MSSSQFVKGECSHCAGHLEFPADAVGHTITCPHCGQQKVLVSTDVSVKPAGSRKLIFWGAAALMIAALLVVVLIGFKKNAKPGGVETTPSSPATAITPASKPGEINTNQFIVSAINLESSPGSSLVYVTGKLQNLSDRQRFGVKVEFGLFDTNDSPVGTAKDYHQVLEPHGSWVFKALVLDSRTASARFFSVHEDQ